MPSSRQPRLSSAQRRRLAASKPIIVSGLQSGDTVSGLSEIYASKNALGADGSILLVSGYKLEDGNSGQNYTVVLQSAQGTILKATARISIKPYHASFNGLAHTAVGSAIGVFGEKLVGLDLSGTTHSAAGTFSDVWTFSDANGNYGSDSGSIIDTIVSTTKTA